MPLQKVLIKLITLPNSIYYGVDYYELKDFLKPGEVYRYFNTLILLNDRDKSSLNRINEVNL